MCQRRESCRHDHDVQAKCVLKAKLRTGPYSHLVWCTNNVVVGAIGGALHFINPETGSVEETVDDAHTGNVLGLSASAAPVPCNGMHMPVVASCSTDGKARLWIVPDIA